MEFNEVLARRCSCRDFADRPVEREKITACMEAGRLSPSGCNAQRWMFIAVDDPDKRLAVAKALESPPEIGINRFVHNTPAFIVVLHHPPRRVLTEKQQKILSKFNHASMDIGIAAHQMCLACTNMGLGSIMIGWFDEQPIKAALKIPDELSVALVIGVGYPKSDPIRKPGRYAPDLVYRWNGFGEA